MANLPTYLGALKVAMAQLTAAHQDPSAAQFILCQTNDWTYTQLIQHYRDEMVAVSWQQYQDQIRRVCQGEPAQYVLGSAPFYGRQFLVTQATLIPRLETEELVDWILNTMPSGPLRVLDVGTGSGAIGVTLAAERPNWQVIATDISAEAVVVARQNAARLAPGVTFAIGDLLAPVIGQTFDLIVSNPPYIDRRETDVMDESVKRFEPQGALFAAEHGLAFYHRLAAALTQFLTPNGTFFAELGYQQGAAIQKIFTTALPTAQVTIKQDLSGRDRMVQVKR